MKRFLSVIIALVLLIFGAVPAAAVFDSGAVTKELRSEVYYQLSLDEQSVLFRKNENKKAPAAGFVKIISAVVATENWADLDEKVKVTDKNRSLVRYDYGVRTAGYLSGEKVSKRELIETLLVYSANDSASIIAYELGGSLEGYLKIVKATLEKIGCKDTEVKNLTGFDIDGQYTTASDMAKIISYGMTYPAFVEAFSKKDVTAKKTSKNEERTFSGGFKMKNSTISDYYFASVTAGKQTSTDKAGECVAAISSQDGYNYLTIVMKGSFKDTDRDGVLENTALVDAKRMLTWTYKNIRYRVVVSPAQVVAQINVVAGKNSDIVKLVPEKEQSSLVPANATPASVYYEIVEGSAPEKLRAPVKKGEVIAKAKLYYSGEELGEVNLVAQDAVKLSFFGFVASKVSALMGSMFFILLVGLGAVGSLAYFLLLAKKYFLDPNSDPKKNEKKAPPVKKKAPPKK